MGLPTATTVSINGSSTTTTFHDMMIQRTNRFMVFGNDSGPTGNHATSTSSTSTSSGNTVYGPTTTGTSTTTITFPIDPFQAKYDAVREDPLIIGFKLFGAVVVVVEKEVQGAADVAQHVPNTSNPNDDDDNNNNNNSNDNENRNKSNIDPRKNDPVIVATTKTIDRLTAEVCNEIAYTTKSNKNRCRSTTTKELVHIQQRVSTPKFQILTINPDNEKMSSSSSSSNSIRYTTTNTNTSTGTSTLQPKQPKINRFSSDLLSLSYTQHHHASRIVFPLDPADVQLSLVMDLNYPLHTPILHHTSYTNEQEKTEVPSSVVVLSTTKTTDDKTRSVAEGGGDDDERAVCIQPTEINVDENNNISIFNELDDEELNGTDPELLLRPTVTEDEQDEVDVDVDGAEDDDDDDIDLDDNVLEKQHQQRLQQQQQQGVEESKEFDLVIPAFDCDGKGLPDIPVSIPPMNKIGTTDDDELTVKTKNTKKNITNNNSNSNSNINNNTSETTSRAYSSMDLICEDDDVCTVASVEQNDEDINDDRDIIEVVVGEAPAPVVVTSDVIQVIQQNEFESTNTKSSNTTIKTNIIVPSEIITVAGMADENNLPILLPKKDTLRYNILDTEVRNKSGFEVEIESNKAKVGDEMQSKRSVFLSDPKIVGKISQPQPLEVDTMHQQLMYAATYQQETGKTVTISTSSSGTNSRNGIASNLGPTVTDITVDVAVSEKELEIEVSKKELEIEPVVVSTITCKAVDDDSMTVTIQNAGNEVPSSVNVDVVEKTREFVGPTKADETTIASKEDGKKHDEPRSNEFVESNADVDNNNDKNVITIPIEEPLSSVVDSIVGSDLDEGTDKNISGLNSVASPLAVTTTIEPTTKAANPDATSGAAEDEGNNTVSNNGGSDGTDQKIDTGVVEVEKNAVSQAASASEEDKTAKSDFTVYGCTSFTAKYVLSYFMQTSMDVPKKLKLTLGGRNREKLLELQLSLEDKMASLRIINNKPVSGFSFDIFVADSTDISALKEMAKQSKIVINCAGPFAKYGSNVVAACAEMGADYVDITGEVNWAGQMRMKYGEVAKKSGARIISFCGFDSVPSDISIFAAVQALKKELPNSDTIEIAEGTTWHYLDGGYLNGGTVATLVTTSINWKHCFSQPVPFLLDDPLVLAHPQQRFDPDLQQTKNRMAQAEWINLLPSFDSFMMMGASASFFMAVINAKIVHASALALKYGPNFVYRERLVPVDFFHTTRLMALSIIPVLFVQIAVSLFFVVLKLPIIGQKFADICFPPGSGPSEDTCRSAKGQVYAQVTTSKDANGHIHRANCYMKFQGDAGNYITSQCLCESAWCLLLNSNNELPPRSDDGFGTPAQLLGTVLLQRLIQTKVRPVSISLNVRKNVPALEWEMYR